VGVMKKIVVGVVIMIILTNLTGCKKNILPQRKEINDLQLVQVIGIDKLPGGADEDCMITIASKNLEAGGVQDSSGGGGEGTGAGQTKALVLTAEGKTLFDAVRNIQTYSNKTIFWGHADYFLIGEEAARDDIAKYIDFFTRDHELRIDSKIYIVKGSTAKDLIEEFNRSNFYIADKLESLGHNFKLLSNSKELEVHELMRFIDIHHASARVPCIYLTTRNRGNEEQTNDIESCGYAIFSGLKLAGFIGTDISRGINIITNTVDSSIVSVKDPSGQDVALEIIGCKTKVIPFFNGDELVSITLKTNVTSNLGEIQSQTDLTDKNTLSYLESQQSKVLKDEMEKVLEKILEFKSDCLEICDGIRLSKPLKWHKIEDQWMQILPEIKFDIQVESKIQRTYDMREPSGSKRRE